MRVFHEKRPASPWRTATIKYTTTMKKSTTAIVAAMMLLSVTGANLNAAASNPNPPSAPAAAAGGDSFTLDGLVYTVVDAANNLVELSGNDGTHPTSVNVISPISYGGTDYTVVSIGAGAFRGSDILMTFYADDNVKSVGEAAFAGCSSMISVLFGDVEAIGDSAFYNCGVINELELGTSLKLIGEFAFVSGSTYIAFSIPASVESIGKGAFISCGSEEFIVDEANQNYCSVDGVLFTKDKAELVAYPYGKTQIEYTVPDGVKRIGEYAFSKIDNIYKINFPESLESIGGYAFYGIYSIRQIDVPAGVTVIEPYTFSHCADLETISLHDGVTTIGRGAFAESEELALNGLPDALETIADSAFYHCYVGDNIIIPAGVKSIGAHAFERIYHYDTEFYFLGKTPPAIPVSVEDVFYGMDITVHTQALEAFKNAEGWNTRSNYKTLDFSFLDNNYVYQIIDEGNKELAITGYINKYLTSLEIPDTYEDGGDVYTVTQIGSEAFSDYEGIESVVLPNTVKSIGKKGLSRNLVGICI